MFCIKQNLRCKIILINLLRTTLQLNEESDVVIHFFFVYSLVESRYLFKMVDIHHLLTITMPNIVGKRTQKYNNNTKNTTTQKYNNNTKIQQQQKTPHSNEL